MICDGRSGGVDPQLEKHLGRGSFDGLPADDRGNCKHGFLQAFENAQDWINAYPRIRWTEDDCLRRLERFTRPWRRFRCLDSLKPKACDARLTTAMYEIFLEWEIAFLSFNNCSHRLIRHRQDHTFHTPGFAEFPCDLCE